MPTNFFFLTFSNKYANLLTEVKIFFNQTKMNRKVLVYKWINKKKRKVKRKQKKSMR